MSLNAELATLESSGLIRLARVEPELEYLFRHTLVQEAAYASLLRTDQRRLHREVGEALERAYAGHLDTRELAPVLGRHFAEAGDDDRARKYLTLAGDLALASYANQEAEGHYRVALTLARADPDRLYLVTNLGRVLSRQSRNREAVEVWREAVRLAQDLSDADRAAWLYSRMGRALWQAGDIPGSLAICEQGLAEIDPSVETPGLAALLHEAGRSSHFNGESARSVAFLQRALDMARRLGAVEVQADTLTTLGILPGRPAEEVLANLTEAVDLAESAGLLRIAVRAHHNLANARLTFESDMAGGQRHFRRAAELARQRGSVSEELFSLTSATGLAMQAGDIATAEAALPALYQLASTLSDSIITVVNLDSLRAMILTERGEWAAAAPIYRDGREHTRASGNLDLLAGMDTLVANNLLEVARWETLDDWQELEDALREAIEIGDRGVGSAVQPRCMLIQARLAQGNLQDARRLLAEVEALAAASDSGWEKSNLLSAAAALAAAEGRWSEAIAGYEQLVGRMIRMGVLWERARIMIDWADAQAARGQPGDVERARALLREAQQIFEQEGAARYARIVETRLQSLTAALYDELAAGKKVTEEMAVAARIQSSLLPEDLPHLPGWQLAARWEPARQTSGDFYDVISLPDGRLGLLIADVSDKGAGAALYMAMSRTVLRTYAVEHADRPEAAVAAANARLLADSRASMFVTVFYGVLDPASGTLVYCNAGHNPPYLLGLRDPRSTRALGRTGLPLGIMAGLDWEQGSVCIGPGEVLVLYTDGMTDAQDPGGVLFGDERLQAAARAALPCSAQEMQDALLAAVHGFVAGAPRADDITVMVVARE